MSSFTVFDAQNAPEGSRAILAGARKQMGFVPNLFGVFAGPRPARGLHQAVAFKTLSNSTNHVAGTPLDQAFDPQAWKAGSAV